MYRIAQVHEYFKNNEVSEYHDDGGVTETMVAANYDEFCKTGRFVNGTAQHSERYALFYNILKQKGFAVKADQEPDEHPYSFRKVVDEMLRHADVARVCGGKDVIGKIPITSPGGGTQFKVSVVSLGTVFSEWLTPAEGVMDMKEITPPSSIKTNKRNAVGEIGGPTPKKLQHLLDDASSETLAPKAAIKIGASFARFAQAVFEMPVKVDLSKSFGDRSGFSFKWFIKNAEPDGYSEAEVCSQLFKEISALISEKTAVKLASVKQHLTINFRFDSIHGEVDYDLDSFDDFPALTQVVLRTTRRTTRIARHGARTVGAAAARLTGQMATLGVTIYHSMSDTDNASESSGSAEGRDGYDVFFMDQNY